VILKNGSVVAGYECIENPTMRAKENQNRNVLDAAFGTIFRIQRSKQKLHIYFSLEQGWLKI
jgi:hypothetical protein